MCANARCFKEFLCSFRGGYFSNRGKLRKNKITKILVAWLFLISSVLSGLPLSGGEALNVYGGTRPGVAGDETDPPQTTESDKPSEEEDEEELYQKEGVWCIGSAKALKDFASKFNNGKVTTPADVKLTADINLECTASDKEIKQVTENYKSAISDQKIQAMKNWTPIGRNNRSFNGKFDGCGYTIKGLVSFNNRYTGLFGRCGKVEICNLNITDICFADEETHVGGLIGEAQGEVTINKCDVSGSFYGMYLGGLIGVAKGGATINECNVSGSFNGMCLGGVIGWATGLGKVTINKCNVDWSFNGEDVGGLIVWASGEVTINKCNVSGSSNGIAAGGFIKNAYRGATINGCMYNGKRCEEIDKGLLVGDNNVNVYPEAASPALSLDSELDIGEVGMVGDIIEPETRNSKAIFIWGAVLVLVIAGAGAVGYKIYRKKK